MKSSCGISLLELCQVVMVLKERYSIVDSAVPFLVRQKWPCLACRKPILFSKNGKIVVKKMSLI